MQDKLPAGQAPSVAAENKRTTTNPGFSLRARFLVLFLVLFIVGSVASYAAIAWFTRDIVATLAGWFAEKSVLYEKARVLQLVVREITLTQKMASSPVLKAWVRNESDPQVKARAIAELEDFRRFFRSKSYFFAIARSGNYYFSDENGGFDPARPRYMLSESVDKDGWFYATLRQVPDYELNVDTDRHLKLTKVWINTVLHDQGKPLAVIGTGVDLSDFIRNVISTPQPGVTNVLLDRKGAIQAHQDVSIIDFASIAKEQRNEQQSTFFNLIEGISDRARFQKAMQELARGAADTRTLEVTIQDKRHIAGITYLPDIKWFMVSLTHPEAAENGTYLAAMVGIRIFGVAVFLLIVGVAFDRMVLRRLASLDAAAREMSSGNYAVKLPQGGDEIGRLARTLEHMARRVETHTAQLEQQVIERTRVLERLAYADFLTGLLNRRGILDRIEMERNRLARSGGKLGVLILDVDHFKRVNDLYGHDLGDAALVHVANRIRAVMRSYDVCSRWGGEEFLVIVPGIRDTATLVATAEKLRQEIGASDVPSDQPGLRLTVSIGCHLAEPAESIDRMLKSADDALYAAKQAGRNRVVAS